MSKKSRKASRNIQLVQDNNYHGSAHSQEWHPLDSEIDGRRDKKYVKNIKPRSEGQDALYKAIKSYSLTLAIGPAGGFTDYEREALLSAGFEGVGLGTRILRAETAALCLLALVHDGLRALPTKS